MSRNHDTHDPTPFTTTTWCVEDPSAVVTWSTRAPRADLHFWTEPASAPRTRRALRARRRTSSFGVDRIRRAR